MTPMDVCRFGRRSRWCGLFLVLCLCAVMPGVSAKADDFTYWLEKLKDDEYSVQRTATGPLQNRRSRVSSIALLRR
jgi:hypothetical protein